MKVLILMAIIFVANLPFGFWRACERKGSLRWVLAIHIPVPFVILLRYLFGFGFSILPLSVLAFFLGQFIGGKIQKQLSTSLACDTSCFFVGLWRCLNNN